MSMLTPIGMSAQQRRRRGARRALSVLLALCLLVGGGAAAWYYLLREDDAVATAGACTPSSTPSAAPVGSAPAGSAAPEPPKPQPTFLPGVPAPAQKVRLNIFNATKRMGLAKSVRDQLVKRKFTVTSVGNDPAKKPFKAPAQVRFGPAGAGAALTVAALVPGAVPVVDKRKGAGVDLILGDGFKALRSPADAAKAATPVPTPTPSADVRPGC